MSNFKAENLLIDFFQKIMDAVFFLIISLVIFPPRLRSSGTHNESGTTDLSGV
jgi:hypothetical protein